VDRGLFPLVMDPRTRVSMVNQIGRTLRRVHDLPLPSGTPGIEPRRMLAQFADDVRGAALPTFVRHALDALRSEEPPAIERPLVVSHNDLNPSNVIYDGTRLMLVDWDVAAANEPLYDLATISLFLRLDDMTCAALIAAHDDASEIADELPARFRYDRRLVGVMCGVGMLRAALGQGHAGDASTAVEAAPTLAEVYQRMREGTLNLAHPDGQWSLGLALVKASL
jgi:aminoglycoside phosphotransferase (APT) family kinase protein